MYSVFLTYTEKGNTYHGEMLALDLGHSPVQYTKGTGKGKRGVNRGVNIEQQDMGDTKPAKPGSGTSIRPADRTCARCQTGNAWVRMDIPSPRLAVLPSAHADIKLFTPERERTAVAVKL